MARFCLLLLVVVVAGSCGDDYVPPPSTGGSGGSGGSAGSGGTSGAGGTSGTGGTSGAGGTSPMGSCDNAADLAALATQQAGQARQLAADCGLTDCGHLVNIESQFKVCVSDCVAASLAGLSAQCADCYGDMAWCSGQTCNTACAGSPCEPICLQLCDEGRNTVCVSALSQCAGRMSIDCLDET